MREAADGMETDPAAPHLADFLRRLDAAFGGYGIPAGLPPRLRAAVTATPRHRFVHRFREGPDGSVRDLDADPAGLLPLVYRGGSLTHVDASGAPLPSTNSEAAYVLWLVDRLGIRPGERVLEIGSGSGWLLGIMAHLAGPAGRATGVEILPELAARSRADLAAIGRDNAEVLEADATAAPIPGGPFDRVMITAAAWDLPARLFEDVAEGGRLLVPLRLPGEEACDVVCLRRDGAGFLAESSVPGWFVPLVGAAQTAEVARTDLDALPFRGEIAEAQSVSCPLWLGGGGRDGWGPAALPFRRYLALSEPGFTLFAPPPGDRGDRRSVDFGLVDAQARSVALCRSGRLIGYGGPEAPARLAAAYRRWTDLGMPGPGAWTLRILPADAAPDLEAVPGHLVERRGASVLVRDLDPEAGAWRSLVESRR